MKTFKDQKVNIVFPISGRGRRFEEAGFVDPKPLVKVFDQLMIEWAFKSCNFFSTLTNYNLIFTVRREHVEQHQIDQKLIALFGQSIIIVIDSDQWPYQGQAGHVLAAKDYINNDSRLFIYSCDTYSEAPISELIDAEDPDGILPCFKSTEGRLSYAKLDQDHYVCETAEKKPISNLASTGHYYFRRGADFVLAVEEAIKRQETFNGEYYMSPLYNFLIKLGRKIRVVLVTNNWELGTPAALADFINRYPVDSRN